MTLTKTRSVGGSLIVTIPKELVEKQGIKKDELVEIEIKKVKISGFGILKGKKLPKFIRKDKFDIE